jgi:hypothetical protein
MNSRSGIWNLKQSRDALAAASYGKIPQIDTITGIPILKGDDGGLITIAGLRFGTIQGRVVFTSGATVAVVTATPNAEENLIENVPVPTSITALADGATVNIKFVTGEIESNSFAVTVSNPTLGAAYGGGFYSGTIDIGGGTCYLLIVAPNATGCTATAWKTTNTATSGTASCVNGFTNTYPALNNVVHPAGNFTATRTIGGFTDWYLGAVIEMMNLYSNKSSLPAGEGWSTVRSYWTSTEFSAGGACFINMQTGVPAYYDAKTYYFSATRRARAIRRVPKP